MKCDNTQPYFQLLSSPASLSTLTAISGSTFGSVVRNTISKCCNCKASSYCRLSNLGPKYFNGCRFVVEQESILYYILCINCLKEAYINVFLANNLSLYLASPKGRARSRCYANNGAIQKVDYKFTVGSLNVQCCVPIAEVTALILILGLNLLLLVALASAVASVNLNSLLNPIIYRWKIKEVRRTVI